MISPHLIFFDAETLPTDRADLIADAHDSVSHPGNLKKPETIAAWWENEVAAAKVEAVRKTLLDGGTGRLASLAWRGETSRSSRLLGIRGKGDIDGSMVADLREQGRYDDIRDYCADDVGCVRRIWCRLNGEDAPAENYDEERRAA